MILQELEGDLVASLREVGRARPESLVAFLPLVLDKLLLLMVKPPTVAGLTLNVGQVQRITFAECQKEKNVSEKPMVSPRQHFLRWQLL